MQSIIEKFGIAGIFAVDESHKSLTICPRHRGLTEQSMVFVGDALQLPTDDAGILASEEEDNFARARATIISSTLQHPITYDICSMAKDGSLASKHLSETGIRGVTKAHLRKKKIKNTLTYLLKPWPVALASSKGKYQELCGN